jgi:HK97 family phage major capsid protein
MAKRSPKPTGNGKFKEVLNRRYDLPVVIDRENGIDADKRTVELSIASDAPIEHWFGRIVLDMSPGSIRLDRMRQGAPLLLNHNADKQVGVLENVRVEEGKLRATARFSRSEFANEIFQDVQDGIRRNTSVGFVLHELDLEKKSDDGPNTYRSKDWEPLEGTIASVPRDISVGVNRDMSDATDDDPECELSEDECENADCAVHGDNAERSHDPKGTQQSPQQIQTRSATMENPNPNGGQPPTSKFVVIQLRQKEFVDFARQCGGTDEHKNELETLAREFALTNKSEEELLTAINEKRSGWVTKVPPAGGSVVTLTDAEKKHYSIARAIMADAGVRNVHGERTSEKAQCFEDEVSQDIQRTLGLNPRRAGFFMPTGLALRGAPPKEMLQRSGLAVKTSTAGAELVFTEPGSFIEMLRNRAMVIRMGATVLAGLQGNVAFPKQTGAGSASWVTENPGSDVADADLALTQVTLSPKTLQSSTAYSRQLLAQSVVNVDNIVQQDLVQVNALAVDLAAIHGLGSSNQPTGIYAQSGVNAVAFGGAITYAKVVEMETDIAGANADVGSMGYLTTPEIRGRAKQVAQLSNTIALPIWNAGEMNGYRAEVSNQVSKVMNSSAPTGGSSHGIVFGVWPELLIGEWGAMEVITDPYRLKKQGMIEVTTFLLADIAVRYAAAFSKGTGLTNS